ncbi:MAG: DMT family transporter [Pseudomonadota bacterium]
MTDASRSAGGSNLFGISLMVLSMAAFGLGDAFVKLAASEMSPAQVAFWLTLGAVVIFAFLALVRGEALFDRALLHPTVGARCVVEAVGAFSMITAFATVPLSTVAAILQASPLVLTIAAATFLKEQVGWRRWMAIMVGFCGVLLIVQPGTGGFQPETLYAVLGMLALSFRDFFGRIVPRGIPTLVLSAATLAAVLPAALIWALSVDGALLPLDPPWLIMAGMVAFGTAGYFLVTLSVRVAELSAVAPFRYSRLLFAGVLGMVIFGERPDAVMYAGAALILGSGLYSMWRERLRAQDLHSSARAG